MPSTSSLTDVLVRKLKATGSERVEVWDDRVRGLGVRASPAGTKSFVLLYRLDGRSRRMTLGRYPVLSLSDARRRATDILHQVTHGHDPQAEKADGRQVIRFDQVLNDFVRLHCQRKNRASTAKETERLLRHRFLSPWKARDIREISKHDVLAILDGIVEAGHPSAANHALAAVRKLFSWAVERGVIEASPCTGIAMPAPPSTRHRVLDDDELTAVWHAAENVDYPYGPIVQLLILTAQRRGEVTGMLWNEIDCDAGLWVIPPERTKNGRIQQVPLGQKACAVIAAIPRMDDTRVFPARGNSDRSFSGFAKLKRRIDEVSGVTDWTLHDIRRSVATGLAAMEVQPHVVEKLLNHASGTFAGVAGIYNRFNYVAEVRTALEIWEKKIAAMVASNA